MLIDWEIYEDDDSNICEPFADPQHAVDDLKLRVEHDLAEWVVKSRIPHVHVSSLLKILNQKANLTFLLLDCRTLLKSKRGKLTFTDMPPGKFQHFSIEESLKAILEDMESKGVSIPVE